jgi:para-nitrobenzyl esterase
LTAEYAISIDGGLVRGVLGADGVTRVYMGMPFAAPPVGERRWTAPGPVRAWNGILSADRFGSACLQPLHARNAFMAQFAFAEPPECGLSEDCLYLNVWTPARRRDARLPVVVWVYGGGFRVGAGSHPVSWGDAMARQDAVVVTLNYRVGALGFLAHPELSREAEASGNYGCMDVLAALQWVQRNIDAFGGDPDCVTLFGQSAGAAIVSLLMASAHCGHLFHRAIVHSSGRLPGGPMGHIKTLAEAEREGAQWMQQCGARSLDEMRNLPADALFGPRGMWNVVRDGRIVADDVQADLTRGGQLRIPLLCGFTRHEASTFPLTDLQSSDKFKAYAHSTFASDADEFLALFPHGTDAEAAASSYEVRRGISFAYQPWKLALLQSAMAVAPVFLFEFDRAVPLPAGIFREAAPAGGFGAYHGAELWYVFNTLHTRPWPWTEGDRELANLMTTYWVNFARSGDPNGDGMPPWPRFEAARAQALLLGDSVRVGAPSNHTALKFFERHFARKEH